MAVDIEGSGHQSRRNDPVRRVQKYPQKRHHHPRLNSYKFKRYERLSIKSTSKQN